LSIVCVIS